MPSRLPPLDSLRAFEAAARHLSFSRAAEELHLSKGAISYRIRSLEEALGAALFRRAARSVQLTPAGTRLLGAAQQSFRLLEAAVAEIRPPDDAPVRIACTTYVAARWLSPRLAAFGRAHPAIRTRIDHVLDAGTGSPEAIDVAVVWTRLGHRPVDAPGRSVREIPMALFPVGSPALLRGRSLPLPPAALADFALLHEEREPDPWRAWAALAGAPRPERDRVVADANVRVQAAIDAHGLVLADALMRAEIDAGSLVAPFEARLDGYGYAVLAGQRAAGHGPTRRLLDWLARDEPPGRPDA